MTQTDQPITEAHPPSIAGRLAWSLLILATLYLCYFHNLGAIGLVGPDEPRYAWIARDMAETGDWVTPRLYGKPWFEKPVLYYWGAALSFKLFGVSEAAARLPSAFSALLATLALAWLALRLYGAETARWLLLLLPTTVGMIGFSHAAATDMPFSAMLTIAMVFAAVILGLARNKDSPILPRTPWFALVFFGFFLGLAVLAKGPAAIILSGGAVLLWALFTNRWRDAFRCLHPVAIASFLLTALPWYMLCARRNPDFFRVFIIEHNFKRYLTPEFQHIQPFWFYIPVVLIAFVPWTLLLLGSASYGLFASWRIRRISPATIFFLTWAAFCLLFFSTSKSKLPGYLLPALPAIALLLSRCYLLIASVDLRAFRLFMAAWGVLAVPAGFVLLWIGSRFHGSKTNTKALLAIGCILLFFTLSNLLLTLGRNGKQVTFNFGALSVVPVLLLVLAFNTLASPWLHRDPSGRTLAAELRARLTGKEPVYAAAMKRGQLYSLSFYLHREVQPWPAPSARSGYLLVPWNRCGELLTPQWTCAGDPVELPESGWFLYAVRPLQSANGPGAPGGDGNFDDRADRQPR